MSINNTPPSWHRLAIASDIALHARSLLVRFDDGRSHRLSVIDDKNGWRLRGLIVRDAAKTYSSTPIHTAALRNRQLRLASLLVDEDGDLVGETLVPSAGITAAEFQILARHLAAECDRLEFMLTGADREAS